MAKAKKTPLPAYQEPSVGVRISDAVELLDSLRWAAHKATSEDDYWLVLSLFRASLPTLGAALEAANVALGEPPIGRYA